MQCSLHCFTVVRRSLCGPVSASANRRGITPQLFAAWGHTQERTVAACPIQLRVVFSNPLVSAF